MNNRKDENHDDSEIIFRNINVSIEGKHILKNVTGVGRQGEMLGVLGPTDSGKSVLLATLAGHRLPYIGDVLVGGVPLEETRGEVAYVEKADYLLPNLTLKETLEYSTMLRIGSTTSPSEQDLRICQVLDLMNLSIFENLLVQFLPKAVIKRLSIACEILTNPSVIILDEPTSCMDFKDGLDLLKTLKHYAEKTGKVLVLSLTASPSSYYAMCSRCLFLYKGHIAYYGSSREIRHFLSTIELSPLDGHHPADFLLELLNHDTRDDTLPIQETIVQATYQLRKEPGWKKETLLDKYPVTLYSTKNLKTYHQNGNSLECTVEDDNTISQNDERIEMLPVKETNVDTVAPSFYTTSYCHQFRVLLARNFRNARRRILFPISLIQNLYILVICILIWWRPERIENTVPDRMGLFFFTVVQWAFFALLDAILIFPKEMKVINKERKYGQYRLSAFCLSKTLGEIPLAILQPCIYMCVMYWVANLNGVRAFLCSVGVIIVDVFAAQSIGLFVGAALRPPWTVTVVSLGLLSMMLWGGAFNTPPPWLRWGKFASFFFYGLNALIVLEFKDAPLIKCKPGSTLPVCNMINPVTNTTFTEFDSDIILHIQNIDWHVWQYVAVLLGIMFVMRFLWYIVLRRQKISWLAMLSSV